MEKHGLERKGEELGTPRSGDPYGRGRQITMIWAVFPLLNQRETLVWVAEIMLSSTFSLKTHGVFFLFFLEFDAMQCSS